MVVLFGCSKDQPTTTPTPTPNVVAGVTLPSSDAGLYTVFSRLDGSTDMQNTAWFGTPNSSTDVGEVKYKVGNKERALTFFMGKYYGIDFLPDSFAVTDWTVAGKNGFPGLTAKDDQKMPIITSFAPTTASIASNATSIRVNNSVVTGADALIYSLVNLTNQLQNKNFVASSTASSSFTFSNADFTPFIQTNNGVVGIPFTLTALKYKTVTVNGKSILLVKQMTHWGSVDVK